MTRFGRLVVVCVLLAAFLSPARGQQLSLADLQSKMVGQWLASVAGENRTRTLDITTIAQKGEGAFMFVATYSFTGEKLYPVKESEVQQSASGIQLIFYSSADSLVTATAQPDGTFAGTIRYKNGITKGIKLEKGAVAVAALSGQGRARTAQDRAFADEDKDWGIEPTSKPQGPPHGMPTPMTIPGAKVIRTLALKALLDANKQVVVVDVLNSSSGTRETIPGAHWMPGAGDGRFYGAEKGRFATAMEKVTGADKNRPLIFLCVSSQCWESYNACLYAIEAGYKDVTWYRGGTNSWKRARLEMNAPERFNW